MSISKLEGDSCFFKLTTHAVIKNDEQLGGYKTLTGNVSPYIYEDPEYHMMTQ